MRHPHGIRIASSLLAIVWLGPGVARAQTTVTVPATTAWFDTGVDVTLGQRLLMIATGEWSNGGSQPRMVGPDGWANVSVPGLVAPRLPLGALIGRVGRRPFLVGARYQDSTAAAGRLFLSMNDTANGFADNQGSLQVSIAILPSIGAVGGSVRPTPSSFIPGAQFTALAGLVLGGGSIQLSQTTTGIERTIGGRPYMSYIGFGPYLQSLGIRDFPIDLPNIEYSPEQLANTGGTSVLVQDILTHKLVFIDRARFLVNNIHSDFDRDLTVRLGSGEVLIDLRLQAPDPAVRGEGNGYTAVLFVPIPLGWEDGLAPDLTIHDMTATLHLAPVVQDAKLHLQDPVVELTGELSLSVGDDLVKDFKAKILKQFAKSLNAQLAKPTVKGPLETALTSLFLAGKPNADVDVINIDSNGVEVIFRR